MDIDKSFADIKDSIARSNAYGAKGHGFQGARVNGKMVVSRAEAESMSSAQFKDRIQQALNEDAESEIAEALGQGIKRRGGNY